ncbi:MAG TPA: hypothetical protein VFQ61_25975 [Polyangiaceae bacterium]|nr:hypothetical protein [Polyangiaceae bacterium]
MLQATWSGYIDQASCGHYPAELRLMLGGRRIRFAIFDALAVTGYAANSHVPGGQLLAVCKDAGAERVIVITDSSAIRMIGSTVALATGLSIRFVATDGQAVSWLREQGVEV